MALDPTVDILTAHWNMSDDWFKGTKYEEGNALDVVR